jgi:hypothetical protein
VNDGTLFAKIVEKWPAKVISLALAIFIVVFHRMNMLEQRFFSAPLGIQANGNLVPASSVPASVRIALRGDSDVIYPIMESDIEAYLDLTRYTVKGAHRIPVYIRKSGSALNAGTVEVRAEPAEILLELDQKMSRYVQVAAQLHGETASGYHLVSQTIVPPQVQIEGPAAFIEKISSVQTGEIDLTGRIDDFTQPASLAPLGPFVKAHSDGVVQFTGIIRPNLVSRTFTAPISMSGLSETLSARLAVSEGSFSVQARSDTLAAYDPPPDVLSVDLSAITMPGSYQLPLVVKTSGDMTFLRAEPEQIGVQVDFKQADY